jgi:single-strand DNA-binding protein
MHMASFNRVVLMGNLTRDPSLRFTPQGTPVGEFGLALNRKRGDQEETSFVEVVVWSKQAQTCHEFLKKGRLVLVEGRLQQDRWQTENGETRSRLVVVGERVQFLSAGAGNGHAAVAAEPEGADAPAGEEVPF